MSSAFTIQEIHAHHQLSLNKQIAAPLISATEFPVGEENTLQENERLTRSQFRVEELEKKEKIVS